MRKQHTILIGTANEGKIKEIKSYLGMLPFRLVTLGELKKKIPEPEEGDVSLEENAIMKARYYGDKTGMLTITDDTGLFIDALNGWPGIEVGRERKKDTDSFDVLLGKMKHVPDVKRGAVFQSVLVLYDPVMHTMFTSHGELRGKILKRPCKAGENHWGYNRLFYIPEVGKEYGSMTVQEKNEVSHRSKSLHKIKIYLQNQYCGRHIIVPCGILIKKGKILMSKRNDPHNPKVHGTWEFPGGAMEMGETFEKNIKREIWEETGYRVKVIKQLHHVTIKEYLEPNKLHYQLYLMPFVCKIIAGTGAYHDEEVLEMRWFDLKDVLKQKLMPLNDTMYKAFLPELKDVIKNFHL